MRKLAGFLTWDVALCLLALLACLVPNAPRTGAFWGVPLDCTWESQAVQDGKPVGPHGLLVKRVTAGSPAEDAGLCCGDLLLGVNGKTVPSREALELALARVKPGAAVALEVSRGGKNLTLKGRGDEPETEAIYYYGPQVVTALVCAALAALLIATQPLRPVSPWGSLVRSLAVVVVGFGSLIVLLLVRWNTDRFVLAEFWPVSHEPLLLARVQQGLCLAVAAGLFVVGTLEVRACLQRRLAGATVPSREVSELPAPATAEPTPDWLARRSAFTEGPPPVRNGSAGPYLPD